MPERKAARQRQILEAAVRAFSRHGYHNCTVAAVAREAGVADGTIYLYFEGKEALLIAAFRHVLEEMMHRLDADLETLADPAERLRRLVAMHLAEMERDPELASFLQIQLRQPEQSIRAAIAEPLAGYARRIEAIIEAGKNLGRFRRDIPTRVVRRVVFGAVDETVSAWLLKPAGGSLADKAEAILDVILGGIQTSPESAA